VFLATGPTDMRKGIDGLFALVENVMLLSSNATL
jgi:hypothetical protein